MTLPLSSNPSRQKLKVGRKMATTTVGATQSHDHAADAGEARSTRAFSAGGLRGTADRGAESADAANAAKD